jgi:hypothetical protein
VSRLIAESRHALGSRDAVVENLSLRNNGNGWSQRVPEKHGVFLGYVDELLDSLSARSYTTTHRVTTLVVFLVA